MIMSGMDDRFRSDRYKRKQILQAMGEVLDTRTGQSAPGGLYQRAVERLERSELLLGH